MLTREFRTIAQSEEVPVTVILKDWLLSYLLKGIIQSKDLPKLAFKGGTCLRKCYFPDYRFSEDLDFTVQGEQSSINELHIRKLLEEVGSELDEPPVHLNDFNKVLSGNELMGYNADIRYWGP